MELHSFTVGPFAENTYLLINGADALLVDPGFNEPAELNAFQQKFEESPASLKAIILTHAHVDHVLGLQKALDQYDVPVYLNDTDRYLWNNFASQAQMFGFQAADFNFDPEPLPATENWTIGSFTFDNLYTPGHAPDHISLYHRESEILIAGDALFREGIGRTDLYKGSMEVLKKSIREKLYRLPDGTTVYPGHGPKTTIGHEKKANPFVRG
ncbi:MAG: MBL fold metallo-hydrolase [Balneolaceae bacterium]|nr:MBL fold metallo-hydrolase [Balneolaceae bacterium]